MVRGEKLNQNDMREYEEKQNCNGLQGSEGETQLGWINKQKLDRID